MTEIDLDEVIDLIRILASTLEDLSSRFCEAKYFKACIDIEEKIKPILITWSRDVESRRQVQELAEESPELGEEGEEESEEEGEEEE